MRTSEEKGAAFLERFLRQTDQKNEEVRSSLMGRLATYFEDELTIPDSGIQADTLKRVISQATESAPGPDGIKYSDLKALNEQEMQDLTSMLNDSL